MRGFLILSVFLFLPCFTAAMASSGETVDQVQLDTVIVQASRYPERIADLSSNVTVIDEQAIKDSNAKYVTDILRDYSGIVVGDFLGNGKAARVDMRGFGDSAAQNVLVLIDGRRINQVDLSGPDWTQIDIDSIERIEIVRGGQSVLYGDNAAGGVVNLITKKGGGRPYTISYEGKMGSYGYKANKGYIEGSSRILDYYASASSGYIHGHRVNSHLETVDYMANLTCKFEDIADLRFSGGYHKDWYGMPGAVMPANINQIGREGSLYPDDKAKTEDFYFTVTPELKKDFGFGEVFFSGDAVVRGRRTNSVNVLWESQNNHHIKTFGLTPKAAYTLGFAGLSNRIMMGLDYYSNTDEINSGYFSAPDGMIIDKDTLGIYMADNVELPCGLIWDGGIRGEWAYYKFNQESVLTGKHEKKPFEYAYNTGLTYRYNDRSSVYLTYSRSFRFPVTDEWYTSLYTDWFTGAIAGGLNLDLKPQTAYTYEIGLKEFTTQYFSVSADYYLMDVKNELYYDPVTYMNSSYPHSVHHGLELESHIFPAEGLDISGAYTYQKAFYVGGSYAGNWIPLVPRHKVSAGINYTFMDSVRLNYLASFVGARYFANDLQNAQPMLKHYTVHNARVSYFKHGFEIFIAVNNILDAEYSEYGVLDMSLTRPGYYPSPGRNYQAGVAYKF